MKVKLLTLFTLFSMSVGAQENRFDKFGKITAADLRNQFYSIDTSAAAVVLSDKGTAAIEGNEKGWFSVTMKRHKVIHILKKNGYHFADVEIPLYTHGNTEEKLADIKAITYNDENGKIIETKLERSNIFTEKRSKNLSIRKFTMPNVKEGSIVEIMYSTTSDYIGQIDTWYFQGSAPVLWSEFTFAVPRFFNYKFLATNTKPFDIKDTREMSRDFLVRSSEGAGATETIRLNSVLVNNYRWILKNVEVLKEERFTSTLRNHVARLEMQLVSQSEPLRFYNYSTSWTAISKSLTESANFGDNFRSTASALSDDLKPMVASNGSARDKAVSIYRYLRDNYTCTGVRGIYATETAKNIIKNKKGSVADINLLLTAMLRNAGLSAWPVILSTTDNGYPSELIADANHFNYVICMAIVDQQPTFLDATQNGLGFGKLLPECYNGVARAIDESCSQVSLFADELREKKTTIVRYTNVENVGWVANVKQILGDNESYAVRKKIRDKGIANFFSDVQSAYGDGLKIQNTNIDSLLDFEASVHLDYQLKQDRPTEQILYFNPMLTEGYKTNPFKSEQRAYPVEMPYTIDESYYLTMEVPHGYELDELPKGVVAKYDEDGDSFFEYLVSHSANVISFKSRLKLNRAYFDADEYPILREFFNMVVKKHAEQIVFRKKK